VLDADKDGEIDLEELRMVSDKTAWFAWIL
jgi:hypothetical protein